MRGGFGGNGGYGGHGGALVQAPRERSAVQDGHYRGGGGDRYDRQPDRQPDRRAMEYQHQQQLMLEREQHARGPVLLSDPRPRVQNDEGSLRGPNASSSSQLRGVERPRDVHLINVHGIADMRTTVDLDRLASIFVNCELSRRTGAQLVIQVPIGQGGPKDVRSCTVKVTRSGQLGVYGRVGSAEARSALKRVARRIRTKGGFDVKFKKFEVRSVVAQTNLGVALSLMKIEKTVPGAHFNTEHNRLDCVRLPCRTVAATADVSASGRMLLRAKHSEEDLFTALDELMPFLRECPVEQLPDLPSRVALADPHRDNLRDGLRRRDSGESRMIHGDPRVESRRPPIELERREAREFKVRIDREGGAVGLDLIHQSGTTLLIKRIKEGPILRWNSTPGRDQADTVQPGDVLIEVNGVGGSSQQMLTTIKGTNSLVFRIRRPGHSGSNDVLRGNSQPPAAPQQGMRSPEADRGPGGPPGDRSSESRTPGRRLAIRGMANLAGQMGAERGPGESRPLPLAGSGRPLSSSPSPHDEGRPAKLRRQDDDRPRRIVGKQLDQEPDPQLDRPPSSAAGAAFGAGQQQQHQNAQQLVQQHAQGQNSSAASQAQQVRANAGRGLPLRLPQNQVQAKARQLREEIEAGASQSDGSDADERRPARGEDSPELVPREWLADPEFHQKAFIFGETADRRR